MSACVWGMFTARLLLKREAVPWMNYPSNHMNVLKYLIFYFNNSELWTFVCFCSWTRNISDAAAQISVQRGNVGSKGSEWCVIYWRVYEWFVALLCKFHSEQSALASIALGRMTFRYWYCDWVGLAIACFLIFYVDRGELTSSRMVNKSRVAAAANLFDNDLSEIPAANFGISRTSMPNSRC